MIENERNLEANDKVVAFFEKQFDKTNYWLSFAEAKNGALIAINVAIMAVLISIFDFAPFLCTLVMTFFLISICICLISFIPNLDNNFSNLDVSNYENLNLLFYADIVKIGVAEKYIELVVQNYFHFDEPIIFDKQIADLAKEIIINSKITVNKYKKFKIALKIDFLAIIFSIMFFIVA